MSAQGDLLFTLDARAYEAALQSAQADSARDAARYASAQAQEQRYAGLIGKDYVTKQDFDEVKANAAALHATLQADAAAVRNARLNLGYCTIRAPISGRTGTLLARQGNLVGANDPNPLVVIQQLVPVQVELLRSRTTTPARFAATPPRVRSACRSRPGDTAAVHEGELAFIDNAVDRDHRHDPAQGDLPQRRRGALARAIRRYLSCSAPSWTRSWSRPGGAEGQRGDFVYLVKPDQTVAMQPVTVADDGRRPGGDRSGRAGRRTAWSPTGSCGSPGRRSSQTAAGSAAPERRSPRGRRSQSGSGAAGR